MCEGVHACMCLIRGVDEVAVTVLCWRMPLYKRVCAYFRPPSSLRPDPVLLCVRALGRVFMRVCVYAHVREWVSACALACACGCLFRLRLRLIDIVYITSGVCLCLCLVCARTLLPPSILCRDMTPLALPRVNPLPLLLREDFPRLENPSIPFSPFRQQKPPHFASKSPSALCHPREIASFCLREGTRACVRVLVRSTIE